MQLTGNIDDIITKTVQIKNGPRAGGTGVIYTLQVAGNKVNVGFDSSYQVGTVFSKDVVGPNKFGEFTLSKGNGSTSTIKSTQGTMGRAFPVPMNDHAVSICRQNALTNAIKYLDLIEDTNSTVDHVLDVAYAFSKWTTGQSEIEEAKKMMQSEAVPTISVNPGAITATIPMEYGPGPTVNYKAEN